MRVKTGGEYGRPRGRGAECTASGVPQETFWPGDPAFPQISAPCAPLAPGFHPPETPHCILCTGYCRLYTSPHTPYSILYTPYSLRHTLYSYSILILRPTVIAVCSCADPHPHTPRRVSAGFFFFLGALRTRNPYRNFALALFHCGHLHRPWGNDRRMA